MNKQWNKLKETIIELRDNDGTATQQEVCIFLVSLMNVLENEIEKDEEEEKLKKLKEELAYAKFRCTLHMNAVVGWCNNGYDITVEKEEE